ncbi:MAG: hypothetical protein ACPH7H_06125 [Porticoccaceae bacterium]
MKSIFTTPVKEDSIEYQGIGSLRGARHDCNYFPTTLIPDSSMWGLKEIRDEYNFSSRAYFEHGIYFGDVILPAQSSRFVNNIVTQSPFRYEFLKKNLDKKINLINNYMYSVNIDGYGLSNDLNQSKPPFCIYFPPHSTNSIRQKFSIEDSLKRVKDLSGDLKIYVSVFHLDYTPYLVDSINRCGAHPICFGSRYSPFFLKNIKRCLTNSKMVITSEIGTHVGYSLACGKSPIVLLDYTDVTVINKTRWAKELSSYSNYDSAQIQKNQVWEVLEKFNGKLPSSGQNYDFLKKIFGLI